MLGTVMTFCLKEDDPLFYRSLDTMLTSLGAGVCRGQGKYIEVFDHAMSKMLLRQQIDCAVRVRKGGLPK